MKTYILIVLCSLLLSCSNKNILIGKYQRKFETIELKNDSTFTYMYRLEWPKSLSDGSWKSISPNEVIINSSYDVDSLPIKVLESKDESVNGTQFKIENQIDPSIKGNITYEIILDGKKLEKQTSEEFKLINPINFSFIQVKVYINSNSLPFPPRDNVMTNIYKVKNAQSNKLLIQFPLNVNMFYYENIKHDTLSIEKNKLYWAAKGNPVYKKISSH